MDLTPEQLEAIAKIAYESSPLDVKWGWYVVTEEYREKWRASTAVAAA